MDSNDRLTTTPHTPGRSLVTPGRSLESSLVASVDLVRSLAPPTGTPLIGMAPDGALLNRTRSRVMTRPDTRSTTRGFTLAELMVAVAIIAIMVAISIPRLSSVSRQRAVKGGAGDIAAVLRFARSRAVARSANCGVKFRNVNGSWHYAIYDDGDHDGVRNDDITKGVDRLYRASEPLLRGVGPVRIGLPDIPQRDPDHGDIIDPDDSPIRFGKSQICSFSPTGAGTPGSVFVSDGISRTMIVRVYGSTGRVKLLTCTPSLGAAK